jgi:hypothetical protein
MTRASRQTAPAGKLGAPRVLTDHVIRLTSADLGRIAWETRDRDETAEMSPTPALDATAAGGAVESEAGAGDRRRLRAETSPDSWIRKRAIASGGAADRVSSSRRRRSRERLVLCDTQQSEGRASGGRSSGEASTKREAPSGIPCARFAATAVACLPSRFVAAAGRVRFRAHRALVACWSASPEARAACEHEPGPRRVEWHGARPAEWPAGGCWSA